MPTSSATHWTTMQGAPGEEERRKKLTAMQVQEQLVRQAQDTLVSARDANAAAAAEKRSRANRSAEHAPSGPIRTSDKGATYEDNGPNDPNDPENRIMNPGTGIGSYAGLLKPEEEPQLAPEEAIPQLFDRMKAYKRHLLAVLNACVEAKPAAEVDEAVAPEYEFCKCVYSPIALRKMLAEAGALEYLEFEDCTANETDREDARQVKEGEPKGELQTDEATGGAAADAAEIDAAPVVDAATDDADDADAAKETTANGSIYDQEGYLVIEEEPEGLWRTTEAGRAFIEDRSPEREFCKHLEENADTQDVFYEVLAFCEEGRSITEIAEYFSDDPRLGAHTFYATRVVELLEQSGALIWKRNWMLTDAGKSILASWRES